MLKHRDAQMVLFVARLTVSDTQKNAWDSSHRPMHAISLVLHCTAEGIALVHRLPSVHETLNYALATVIAETPGNSLTNLSYQWSVIAEDQGAYRGTYARELPFAQQAVVEGEMQHYLQTIAVDPNSPLSVAKAKRALIAAAPVAEQGALTAYFFP